MYFVRFFFFSRSSASARCLTIFALSCRQHLRSSNASASDGAGAAASLGETRPALFDGAFDRLPHLRDVVPDVLLARPLEGHLLPARRVGSALLTALIGQLKGSSSGRVMDAWWARRRRQARSSLSPPPKRAAFVLTRLTKTPILSCPHEDGRVNQSGEGRRELAPAVCGRCPACVGSCSLPTRSASC